MVVRYFVTAMRNNKADSIIVVIWIQNIFSKGLLLKTQFPDVEGHEGQLDQKKF